MIMIVVAKDTLCASKQDLVRQFVRPAFPLITCSTIASAFVNRSQVCRHVVEMEEP